ncbi:MAG: hypothetical protein PGN23_01525 [Sphingomonas adhaesiva]|uniref:hypothetical protein n=1 Tax=Sphingomonas adhaesiva TaxID=28212 RepID=UPI002FF75E4B
MIPAPRRNLALFTFGAAILSGCGREEDLRKTGVNTTAPHQVSPVAKGVDAPPAADPVAP